MTDLSQLLRYKKNLGRCLSELSQLSGRSVQKEELLSLEATEAIREEAKKLKAPCQKFEIDFFEKASAHFRQFINRLYSLSPIPIYIWTLLSNDCGLFEIESILKFNFDFDYKIVNEGIIVLLTKDSKNKMVLDFFEDPMGKKRLEVELIGEKWGTAQFR